ncbi:MAG: PEGA domain-containing protein [Deltaproteobacteria bacterium]
MKRFLKSAVIAAFAVAMLTPIASARGRGGVVVVPYYSFYYGPAFYPRWWGPGWGYYPWYGPTYYRARYEGQVKIETKAKGNAIYVDGGYAGVTGKLKKFPLRPGTHTIELRDSSGHPYYQERVNVIAGKTLKIRPDFPG